VQSKIPKPQLSYLEEPFFGYKLFELGGTVGSNREHHTTAFEKRERCREEIDGEGLALLGEKKPCQQRGLYCRHRTALFTTAAWLHSFRKYIQKHEYVLQALSTDHNRCGMRAKMTMDSSRSAKKVRDQNLWSSLADREGILLP
jgi:hypothetical protein